ncbi:TolC family protein [Edaphobacter modestus]|uniref:Outer membrane protein TolC n=1 Tax=Edaphobacter modestus TaxID=388466 RepID=A0A4Q7YUI7_9BACT|nr:TolC family protein [Edaphobacter modestus]RZU41278.1 outer membrane protein TolC [Edaphobacter modestus]
MLSSFAAAQQTTCTRILTMRDAQRCTASIPDKTPELLPDHVYSLPELIDLAENANPETRIAWAAARAQLERAGVERAAYLPVLAFAAQGSDVRAIVPFPQPIAPRGYVTVEQPIAKAQLELEYALLDFRRGARFDASRDAALASTLRLGRTHQQVAYNTATLFAKAQLENGRLEAAKTILHTAETLAENAQSQFDNGRTTLPDLQNAQAGVAEARFALVSAEGSAKKSRLALTEALGVEPTTDILLAAQHQFTPEDELAPKVDDLIHAAWKQRPDLLARADDLKSAQANIESAHAAYLPAVKLAATGGQTATWPSADWGQLGYANVSTWSAAVNLRWEIFNGARSHEVAAARAEARSASEEQRAQQDRVTREVWQAYVDLQTAFEQQRAAKAFLDSTQTSYDSSLEAYQYGVRSLVDVVQAERQLAQARLASVDAEAQLSLSAAALTFATGAGVQP